MKRKTKKRLFQGLIALAVLALAVLSVSGRGRGGAGTDAQTAPGSPAVPAPAASPEAEHKHSWEPVYETVHHEAVTEGVWVLDKEAWLEPKEAAKAHCACRCGFSGSYEQVTEHIRPYREAWQADPSLENELAMQQHAYDTSQAEDWIVHEAEGHWEEQVIREPYDGPGLAGLRCSVCGEERRTGGNAPD